MPFTKLCKSSGFFCKELVSACPGWVLVTVAKPSVRNHAFSQVIIKRFSSIVPTDKEKRHNWSKWRLWQKTCQWDVALWPFVLEGRACGVGGKIVLTEYLMRMWSNQLATYCSLSWPGCWAVLGLVHQTADGWIKTPTVLSCSGTRVVMRKKSE